MSQLLEFATAHASACISTEFLGECRIAIREVLSREKGALTDDERGDLIDILKQLDKGLDEC